MGEEEAQGEQESEFRSLHLSWPPELPPQTLLAFAFEHQEELLHAEQPNCTRFQLATLQRIHEIESFSGVEDQGGNICWFPRRVPDISCARMRAICTCVPAWNL